jgi:ribonucleoside-triphosphate reductase (thioredoxin)
MELSSRILSDITVYSKYARYIPEQKRRESWDEIVTRNMMMHLKRYPQLAEEIGRAFQYVYEKKVLPSMRSLQFGGKPIELNPTRQYNCSFLPIDSYEAFHEIMFLLLSGCGVGYSVQQQHIAKLPPIMKPNKRRRRHLIADNLEGWADAIKVLMKSYFFNSSTVDFDYSAIRPKGAPLKTAGGKAPGPQPLKDTIHNIKKILDQKEANTKLTSLEIHDIICFIADAVLSGGIRRSAMIALFSFDDQEMVHCKYGEWWKDNPQRARANNSALAIRHKIQEEDFTELWKKIELSNAGEPGIIFSNNSDWGTNPCGEIALRPFQFCNLCEVNVSELKDQQDFEDRVKAAAFLGTLQAGYTDFHYLRDIWRETTEKDALLGIGMTGIASGRVLTLDMKSAANVAKKENERVSKIIGINKAARVTTVKPSGTSSLVLGCSSGIHAWHSLYYIRRMRVLKNESIYQYLKNKIPQLVEDDFFNPGNQAVISIPIKAPNGAITRSESAIDLADRVKTVYMQWVKAGHRKGDNSNNVSATITVKPDEWTTLIKWMWDNKEFYNGLSVLPADNGSYIQAPYEECTKEKYEELFSHLEKIDLSAIVEEEDKTELQDQAACSGPEGCEVK